MNLVGNELTARGWPVALVPINSGPPDQVTPICDVFPLNRKWRGNILNTVLAIWRFNAATMSWKPDVIVLNCDLPELFGVFLLSKFPLVAIEHINRPWITRKRFGKIVRKFLEVRGVTWVAVSSHLSIWPREAPPTAVLLNPINARKSTHTSNSRHIESQKLTLLVFVGRLAKQKRPDWLLEIAPQTHSPVDFIGDGTMLHELRKTAAHKNIDATFSGQVLDPWSKFSEGKLLIIPSEYEGDGLVVIEGLQENIPMLLADIPDFRRFGFPEHNYCVDVSDFVERIKLFRDRLEELTVPIEISRPILTSRTLLSVGDSWEKFLNELG